MAHTEITFTDNSGVLIGNQSSVSVTKGDTVAFSINAGQAFLFFSPDAAAALSPSPNGPVRVSASAGATFTFTSSDPGAYSVFPSTDASVAPTEFSTEQSDQLWFVMTPPRVAVSVEAAPVVDFGGPSGGTRDVTRSGS